MNTRIARIAMAFAAVTVLAVAPVQAVEAKGLIGGVIKSIGHSTGSKHLVKFGSALDRGHKELKEKVLPIYGLAEEVSSRIVRETGRFIKRHPAESIAAAIVIATAGVACMDGCAVIITTFWAL